MHLSLINNCTGLNDSLLNVKCPTEENLTCLGSNHCQLRAVKCRTIGSRTIKLYSDI